MSYQRYLDIHLGQDFGAATFKNDVKEQTKYQETKGVDYRSMVVDEISVVRKIKLSELSENIEWVCRADKPNGGKLRINSHGDTRGTLSTNTRGSGTLAVDFAKYLALHGLKSEAMGKPGLTTINLACCYAAMGPEKDWMIKAFADELKLPGVKVTGAAAITRMVEGKLQVRYEAYVPPHKRSTKYVPPRLRTMAVSEFSGSVFKKSYTYAGGGV
jgi:hypothetical protein